MRGMGRLYKRPGSNAWWISYSYRGKEKRESSGSDNKSDARRLLKKRIAEIGSGTFVGPTQERVTFDMLEGIFIKEYEKQGHHSIASARSRIKHLRMYFGLNKALDITPDRLASYQSHRLDEGAERATVNRELSALRRMFTIATKQQLLSVVPVFPDKLKEAGPRTGFFEHDQYLAIRQHLASDDQDILDFGYFSGWRLREITEMPWSEVDREGGVIRLAPERSKSRRGRVLPITPPIAEILKRREAARLVEHNGEARVVDVVFHRDGQPIVNWRKRWLAACVAAGFYNVVKDETGKEKTVPTKLFHDLRRTCVRNLVRSGVDPHLAMKLTGHETDSVFRSYDIVNENDLKNAGKKLTEYMAAKARKGTK